MILSYKKWSLAVAGSILFLVGTVALLNGFIDANGIFHDDLSLHFHPPNMSYAKIRYLLQNVRKFDSFLFGSSRAGSIDVKKLSNTYYNMFYPGGLPEEHYQNILFLLENGVPIKSIMVALDDFSFMIDPRSNLSELDLQPHPAVSGKRWPTFYGEYLFRLNKLLPTMKAYVRHQWSLRHNQGRPGAYYDIAESGRVFCSDCDDTIENNIEAHISSPKFQEPWDYRRVLEDRISPTLAALRSLVDLSKKHGFNLVVFINPIHRVTYLNADLELFARFKKELAEVTAYYDFSGLNSITTNNYYYYETSHYRTIVGDMMLRVMFGVPIVAVPPDFGFRVTSENVLAHLEKQCVEINSMQIQLKPINAAYATTCGNPSTRGQRVVSRHQ